MGCGPLHGRCQIRTIKDIITQYQCAALTGNETLTDEERLCQSIGTRLHSIGYGDSPLIAISQKCLETFLILRRRNDQNILYTRQQQCAQGIIYHGFIINWHELLAHHLGERVQACSRTSGQ